MNRGLYTNWKLTYHSSHLSNVLVQSCGTVVTFMELWLKGYWIKPWPGHMISPRCDIEEMKCFAQWQ